MKTYKTSPKTLAAFFERVERVTGYTKEMLQACLTAYTVEAHQVAERFSIYGGRDIAFKIWVDCADGYEMIAPRGSHRFSHSNYFLSQTRGWRGSIQLDAVQRVTSIGSSVLACMSQDDIKIYDQLIDCRTDAKMNEDRDIKKSLEYTRTVLELLIARYDITEDDHTAINALFITE